MAAMGEGYFAGKGFDQVVASFLLQVTVFAFIYGLPGGCVGALVGWAVGWAVGARQSRG